MGSYLKYNYYMFLKVFSREPLSISDLFDGLNFIHFYSEKGGML